MRPTGAERKRRSVVETYLRVKGRWMYLYRAVDSRPAGHASAQAHYMA